MAIGVKYSNLEFKLDEKLESRFAADFERSIRAQIKISKGHGWENSERIIGTICEKIQKTNIDTDCVTVPIENERWEDGGYIHVNGWSEVID